MKGNLNLVINNTEISTSTLMAMYITILKIRKFEERVSDLLLNNEIKCPTHLYIGQEALATGVCANLKEEDYVFSTHRSHGHYIAKGGDLKLLMAELYTKRTGCSKGKGGSMHIVAPEIGFLGSSSIVGGNLPLSVGVALASSMLKNDRVSVAFFGDGATDEGVFHESLNFASLKKLPVLFICENNLFSTHLPLFLRQPTNDIYKKVESYLIPGICVDGNNVLEVFEASRKAIERARNGGGPTLIEGKTFRWRAHVGPWLDIDISFRTKELVEEWTKKCPLMRFEKFLQDRELLSEKDKEKILKEIEVEIEESIDFAKRSPYPSENELEDDLFKI